MLKFVYATDLHGDPWKYRDVLRFALRHDIKLIHLGADLLPKGSNLLNIQKTFVKGFLKDFYEICHSYGIIVLAFFGNDDIYTCKKYFREYASLLDEEPCIMEGFEFKAYPYVLDYPFGLKTACKLDKISWRCKDPYLTDPCDFNDSGHYVIKNVEEYFNKKGTLEDDLKDIHADNKTIMAMHMPPHALGLDVCYGNKRVGSESILNWIIQEQPLFFLTGHIHESPEISNIWKIMVGKTMVIQPGQKKNCTTMVYIEIDSNKINAQLIG